MRLRLRLCGGYGAGGLLLHGGGRRLHLVFHALALDLHEAHRSRDRENNHHAAHHAANDGSNVAVP